MGALRRTLATLALAAAGIGVAAGAAAQASAPRLFVWETVLDGEEDGEVRWPVAVAAASAEELAVADAFGPRLLRFRKDALAWKLERSVPLPGAPVDLAWDGTRYVASVRGEGLVAFEGEDLLQRRVPLPDGVVPGALAAPATGGLLVYDVAGGRVIGPGGGAGVPVAGRVTALAASPGGGFHAAFGAEGEVARYDAAGQEEARWSLPAEGPQPAWPAGLAVEPGGDVLVVDRHGGRVVILDSGGKVVGLASRKGWDAGLLLFPMGAARLPDGRLVVADQGNGRVQVFRRVDAG
jgi:DNA-binding beta-propeller fold protein YncE